MLELVDICSEVWESASVGEQAAIWVAFTLVVSLPLMWWTWRIAGVFVLRAIQIVAAAP